MNVVLLGEFELGGLEEWLVSRYGHVCKTCHLLRRRIVNCSWLAYAILKRLAHAVLVRLHPPDLLSMPSLCYLRILLFWNQLEVDLLLPLFEWEGVLSLNTIIEGVLEGWEVLLPLPLQEYLSILLHYLNLFLLLNSLVYWIFFRLCFFRNWFVLSYFKGICHCVSLLGQSGQALGCLRCRLELSFVGRLCRWKILNSTYLVWALA